jgi:hypothetical protein
MISFCMKVDPMLMAMAAEAEANPDFDKKLNTLIDEDKLCHIDMTDPLTAVVNFTDEAMQEFYKARGA